MSRDKKESPTSSMVNCCMGKVSAGSEGPRTKAWRPQAGKPLEPHNTQAANTRDGISHDCSFEERQPNNHRVAMCCWTGLASCSASRSSCMLQT